MFKSSFRRAIPLVEKAISTQWVQASLGNFVPVFMLHRFEHPDYGVSGKLPASTMQSLELFRKRGYHALSLSELASLIEKGQPVPYKSAVFTIDDGFIDQHDIAAPLFSSFDIPLTFFLITDFVDGKLWPWDDQLAYLFEHAPTGSYTLGLAGDSRQVDLADKRSRQYALHDIREYFKQHDNTNCYSIIRQLFRQCRLDWPGETPVEYRPMSWSQAQSLEKSGHEVAAHTCTHRILSRLNDMDASNEITQSIATVNNRLGRATSVFAYPTGRLADFTEREYDTLDEAGIKATVSTVHKSLVLSEALTASQRHSLPRFSMPDSPVDFIQYLSWIEYIKNKLRKS